MISVTKLRNGVTFAYNDAPWRVTNYQHTHMSRGGGTIKVKCRNLQNGQTLTLSFKSGDHVDDILILKQKLQYLYADGNEFVFMHPDSFEQLTMSKQVLGDLSAYLKEGEMVDVLFWDETPLDIDLPPKMTFEVVEAAPGEKGDSASNVYKDAVLENGLKVRVPLFVNAHEKIRIDTRTGEYVERA